MISRCTRWLTMITLLMAMAAPVAGRALNGLSPLGYGARSNGMGGVGVAYAQDSFASAHNPAGLNYVKSRFDFGFGWLFQKGEATHRAPTGLPPLVFHSGPGLWLPEFGATLKLTHCQAVGIAVYPNGMSYTKYSLPIPNFGTTPTSTLYYNLWITPSWSWSINCIHSFGVALNIAIGWLDVKGVQAISPASVFPNDVSNRGIDTNEGFSIRIGWLGEFLDTFKIGATFQTKTWTTSFKKYQGLLTDHGSATLAPEAALGFSWYLMPCVHVAGDVLFRLWNGCPTFANTIRQTGTLGAGFGLPNGPGLGWQNQIVLKVGADWEIYPWFTVRAGFNYCATPITPSETAMNQLTLATVDNHVSIGATYSWCYAECTFYYWHGFDRKVSGINSTNLIGVTEIDLRNRQEAFAISYTRFY